MPEKPILLFDGVCNLCNGLVQFVIKQDPHAVFQFASLQSDTGQRLLAELGWPTDHFDTFILVDKGRFYTHSTGILRGARLLGGWWALAYVFIVVPRPIRDAVYRWVARNRYRWFGKKSSCWLPTPELKSRFLP